MREKQIIGDLWLYNQAPTPVEPEWADKSELPFLNPFKFVKPSVMAAPLGSVDQVKIIWNLNPNGTLLGVHIQLRGKTYGKLAPGSKPGWTIAVSKDGPLAKVMH